jgi:hypothetical protein
MSHVPGSQNRIQKSHHKPKENAPHTKPKIHRVKRITCRSFLQELSNFAEEFGDFNNDAGLPTPQADLGIGPVKYDIQFYSAQIIRKPNLMRLDTAVKLEQFLGDELIKFDSKTVCAGHNREDPKHWVPAALRVGIRLEISK